MFWHTRWRPGRPGLLMAWGLVLVLAIPAALADDDGDEEGEGRAAGGTVARRGASVPTLPLYQQECSGCHMAYPSGLLPAASWRRLMANLPQHFGTDASLDPKSVAQITGWLTAHAGAAPRSGLPPQDRITTSSWFVREHDEIAPAVWRRKAIGSPSNCIACHAQAEQGVFHEHDVRIPR